MLKQATTLAAAASLGACAATPDVTYSYYLAKSNTVAAVTQTIACNGKNEAIVSYAPPIVSTTYAADYQRGAIPISLHNLNSQWADNSFTMNLMSDGRLAGSNGTWTGQGQVILQAAITTASTALAFGAGPGPEAAKGKSPSACDIIAMTAADGKTLTFVYTNTAQPVDLGGNLTTTDIPLQPLLGSNVNSITGQLRKSGLSLPEKFVLKIVNVEKPDAPLRINDTTRAFPEYFTLQKTARVSYEVRAATAILSYGNAVVPRTDGVNDTYQIPITKAALFGTQSFALTLQSDGSGGLATSTYGDNAGTSTANVINVVNSGLTAAKPQ